TTAKTVFRQTSMLETNEIMPENSNKKMTYHLVKSHETLQSIAEQYYTNAELITEANNLSSKHRLKTGEILLIITY
ncbi:MAG TPA: LysM domain-containing protein, partial [Chitinophagales bacterium]|nr:LysM domain-containing protein [Chitinophagales bacterium]